ncbi:hypothetical protein [Mycolicibacterium litorale]|uniref:hypothetical protein n=1 Tax=Mycolicibacterium litorale TaxID=758802 RepID=UPI00162949F2|nr:hypothetical protein [Mycolicibacterium litorale]
MVLAFSFSASDVFAIVPHRASQVGVGAAAGVVDWSATTADPPRTWDVPECGIGILIFCKYVIH